LIKIKNSEVNYDEIICLADSFKKAKIIFMITYGKSGEEHIRAMTNFNDNPYEVMWFATATSTRKVEDIKENKKVLLLFPALADEMYYELEGEGYLSSREEVNEKWVWWWLYWHPHQAERFWESGKETNSERTIIKVKPLSAQLLHGSKAEDLKKKMPKF